MKPWDTSEAGRYKRAHVKHWIDRLGAVFAGIFLVTLAVRIVAGGGINTNLEASTYVWSGLFLTMLLFALVTGIRAWLRSEPKVPENPMGKRISDEVMDLGHGEFDPVWMRRSGIKGILIWSAVAFASGAFYYLADDDLRPLGLVVGAFAILFVVMASLAVLKIDRKRRGSSV